MGATLAASGHAAGEDTMSKDLEFPQEYEEAIASLDREQMRIDLEQFGRDSRYLSSIIPELRAKHPDCWVAVYHEQIVGVGPNLKELLARMNAQGLKHNLALEYISKEPVLLIV